MSTHSSKTVQLTPGVSSNATITLEQTVSKTPVDNAGNVSLQLVPKCPTDHGEENRELPQYVDRTTGSHLKAPLDQYELELATLCDAHPEVFKTFFYITKEYGKRKRARGDSRPTYRTQRKGNRLYPY